MSNKDKGKTIMIVDNEPDIVEFTKTILEMEGYRVITAYNGYDCIEKLKVASHIDLIILDIMMPGMSGWDVAAWIREDQRWDKTPIVFLTVLSDPMTQGIGRMAASDYIIKPFEKEDLLSSIEKILRIKTG
jgi:DNA-binding response OmpR family regulator